MKLSQRLWDTYDDEALFEITLDMIKKHPNSCDDVWLTTAIGYPSVEGHKKHAAMLTRAAKAFREAGVSVSLQVDIPKVKVNVPQWLSFPMKFFLH